MPDYRGTDNKKPKLVEDHTFEQRIYKAATTCLYIYIYTSYLFSLHLYLAEENILFLRTPTFPSKQENFTSFYQQP